MHEELSAVDPGMCLSYLAHSMLYCNNLARNGNDALREKYLPDACSGKAIGGMCMSEPDFGTDVLGMKVRHLFFCLTLFLSFYTFEKTIK